MNWQWAVGKPSDILLILIRIIVGGGETMAFHTGIKSSLELGVESSLLNWSGVQSTKLEWSPVY